MSGTEGVYAGKIPDRIRSYQRSREKTAEHLKGEREFGPSKWQNYDSPLLEQESRGPISFDEYFRSVLPSGVSIREYIQRELQDRGGRAIGIEFGGPGTALFSGFSRGFFSRSLGITLEDLRSEADTKYDKVNHHTVQAGDLEEPKTQEEVRTWLNGEKADLIIERMMGPLFHVPKDPYYMAKYLSEWYKMLSENGVMFIEVPLFMDSLLAPWIGRIAEEEGIEVSSKMGGHAYNSRFRLKKLPGAPAEIPLLTTEQVRHAYRDERLARKGPHRSIVSLLSRFIPHHGGEKAVQK